jgi:serine/threonine protein kinase
VSVNTRVGTEVAGYRLEKVVGRGGMSCVYLAEHIRLGRKVALKILASALSEDEGYRERFVRESRRAAELEHPNIIPIYDAGEDDGELYIAMRYVEGADLKAIIKRDGPLRLGHVLFILEQVADALDAAHERDLVHRDVKPSNILVSEPSDRVYLTDFGVVKHTASRGLTKTGFFIGTVDYAPPEQIEGLPLDSRTDVYALGCVFYECLTGRAPYDRDGEVAVMHAHLTASPPKLTVPRPDLPKALNEVVATAMAKSKEERYASCGDMMVAAREAALQRPTTMRRQLQDLEAQGAVPVVDPSAGPPPAEEPTFLPEPVAASEAPVSRVSAEAPVQAPAPPQPPPGDTAIPVTPPTQGGPDQPSRSRFWRSPWIVTAVLVIAAAAVSGLAVYFVTNSSPSPSGSAAAPTKPKPSAQQAPQVGLTALIPTPLFKNSCKVAPTPLVAGAVQSATCSPPTNAADRKLPFYPDRWDVSIFPNQTALDSAYNALRQQSDTGQNFGACNNVSWGGESPWNHGPGKPGGRRFCYFEGNVAVIAWTHDKIGQASHIDLLGTAREGGSDHPALFNWWRFWHHKIGKCPDEGCVAKLP